MIKFDTSAFEADMAAIKRDIEVQSLAAFRGAVGNAAEASTEYRYHNRTGRLTNTRRSLVSGNGMSGWTGQIVWTAPYALYVDKATKGHPIVATKAKMLRFYINGNVVFRKRVWHPGTIGSHFSTRAEDYFRNVGSERLQAGVDSAIQAHP